MGQCLGCCRLGTTSGKDRPAHAQASPRHRVATYVGPVSYTLGVDLGTTYTAAAVCENATTRVISLAHDRYAIPSVVAPPIDGSSLLIGASALTVAATEPGRVAREFKRRFGDSTPMVVGGEPWMPEQLTGLLLRVVVDKVRDEMGRDETELILTYPAIWREHRLDLLREMVESIGVPKTRFLSEPVAAAINYQDRQHTRNETVPVGSLVAVYDLGGGTFDAAVLELQDKAYQIRGEPEGLGFLGGIDFDLAVLDIVKERAAETLASVDFADPQIELALARLRQECTLAKEVLSNEHSAIVPVVLPGNTDRVLIQRAEFEERIDDLVEQTVDALERSLNSAGLASGEDVDAVLLVGGSSRVPLVAARLTERLGVPVRVDTHPKQAVALGAARATISKPAAKSAPMTVDSIASLDTVSEPTVLPPMTVAVSGFQTAAEERYLVALNGPMSGTALALTDEITTIGRLTTAGSVGLNDARVSRRHFEVAKSKGEVSIRDLGSTNGTWIDGVRVEGMMILEPGSIIEVGSTLLLLEAPFFTLPAPEMLAASWSMPPLVVERGFASRFKGRAAVTEWLGSLQPSLRELETLVDKVRRSRRVFRPNGPRTLAWFENAPERVYPRTPQDEHYGSVTLGHGPRPSLFDLAAPKGLKGDELAEFTEMMAPYLIDPWVPISLSLLGRTMSLALPATEGKALLRSLLYEFVHFHPDERIVLFGVDPQVAEWSFLQSGNCVVGNDHEIDHEGLVVSYDAGRIASVGVSKRGEERGTRGTVRVTTEAPTLGPDDAAVVATPEDGVFQFVKPGDPALNFIPATLPAGRVPTTRPVP